MNCAHKTWRDFTLPQELPLARPSAPLERTPEGKIIIRVEPETEPLPRPLKWRCSDCGDVGVWGVGWMYYGVIECRVCWSAAIERVHCPACAEKLQGRAQKEAEAPTKAERSRTRREASVAAKLALAEAKVARLRAALKDARK